MNVLVFDIETIPDIDSGRRLYGNHAEMKRLSDENVARVMFQQRNQETTVAQTEMLRPHLQKVVAISAVLRTKERLKVDSLGTPESNEVEIVQQFFKTVQYYMPMLVSWNGTGYDLPVLHYRALKYGIYAQRYWDRQDKFRFDNYLNRYHERHTDLMDVLAGYQPHAYAPLYEIATLLGFPSKLGMSGERVWEVYLQENGIQTIRNYCETDALNTYLIFLRFELMRGHLSDTEYIQECQCVRNLLAADKEKSHFQEFLQTWTD